MTQRDLLTASAIETEGFTLETLTPLFMHGNRRNLEVRVPSIKGVLRYWWRTLQDSPSKTHQTGNGQVRRNYGGSGMPLPRPFPAGAVRNQNGLVPSSAPSLQ